MKKKGFTLIELLAVIIILAIVALVATPIILDVVADSRNSAGLSEAKSIYGGINSYCATSKSRYELTGKEDICADGVTKEEVKEMVNLGNAEVLFVKYKDGKVIRLVVKSNGKIYELQNDGTFKVIDEYVPDQTAPVIAKTAYYDKAGKITDYLDIDFGENEGTYECEKELKDLTEATNKVKCTAESEYGVTTEQEVTFIANVLKTASYVSSSSSGSDTTWLNSPIKRNQVKSITTVDHKNIPEGATSWDVSARGNGSVMAWYGEPDENGLYDLYIGQNGGVMAGSGYYLFAQFNKLENIELDNFDTSNVTDMSYIFLNNYAITLDLSNFDTSKVTNMSSMFSGSQATSLDLSKLDTSNVTNMGSMFGSSQATEIIFGDKFNTSKVTNMSGMFSYIKDIELDLSSLDTSNVVNMGSSVSLDGVRSGRGMFEGCRVTSLDLSSLNTSNVTNMAYMFSGSQATSLDLSNFDTSKVRSMYMMFSGSKASTLDLGNFDTSSVTNMSFMFKSNQASSLNLSNFNTENVLYMQGMFAYSQAISLDLSSFDTTNVLQTFGLRDGGYYGMFEKSEATEIIFGPKTTFEKATNMRAMFSDSKATSLDLSNFDTSNVTSMYEMFYNNQATTITGLNNFNTSKVTNMSWMFYNSKAKNLDLSSFDTSKVTDMSDMFRNSQAKSLDLSNFDTRNVVYTRAQYSGAGMFYNSKAIEIKFGSNSTFENATNMSGMFSGNSATTITGLNNFNTSKVTNMSSMFSSSQATELDLSSFDTSKVTDMSAMFAYSQVTSLDLSNFNTSNVTNMVNMFSGSKATSLDLSEFDTSNVTNMVNMFSNSKATTGYARTQEDADKLNASSGKPSALTFVVKPTE